MADFIGGFIVGCAVSFIIGLGILSIMMEEKSGVDIPTTTVSMDAKIDSLILANEKVLQIIYDDLKEAE